MASCLVTRGGRITIPVEIRRELNIKEGDRVRFIRDGNGARIEPVGDVVAQTAGSLSKYRKVPAPTIAELKEAFERGVAEEVVESMNR